MGLTASISTTYKSIASGILRAIAGYTDGPNCDGSGTYVIDFSKVASWTDQTDVFFTKDAVFSVISADPEFLTACGTGTWLCLGATISGGVATLTSGDLLLESLTFNAGQSYKIQVRGVGGTIGVALGNGLLFTEITLDGTDQVISIVAGATDTNFGIEFATGSTGTVLLDYAAVLDPAVLTSGERIQAIATTLSPSQQVLYSIPAWAVAELVGDAIELDVGVLNNYLDADLNPMQAQAFTLTNCLDLTPANAITLSDGTTNIVLADGLTFLVNK